MNAIRLFTTILVLVAAPPAGADGIPGLQGLGNTDHLEVVSAATESRYHVLVGLPESYDSAPDRHYPTLYILDGGELYPMLAAYYRYLRHAGDVPEMLLVGISYGTSDWRSGNSRGHDYTAPSAEREHWGGAADFQEFLAGELIPRIERDHRALPDRRVLFGQSIGGQFVLYSAQTRPDLFWGRIASNPALHRNLPFFLGSAALPSGDAERPRLFVASASGDDPVFREPALAWMGHWTEQANKPWDLETMTLEGHNHFSVPPASFRQGMLWLFEAGN